MAEGEVMYGETVHGKRVHLVREGSEVEHARGVGFCGARILFVVDGPRFPRTLCDHCQRVQRKERK